MTEGNNEPNSFYIGDIKKDMLSPIMAGATFIHAKYGFEPNLKSTYYIEDIKDLPMVLKQIKNKDSNN